jgi:hypothetical protein
MRAPDHAQALLLMARKDFDALRGMLDNPLSGELMPAAASSLPLGRNDAHE